MTRGPEKMDRMLASMFKPCLAQLWPSRLLAVLTRTPQRRSGPMTQR
jgi:hypothetical protein